MKVIVSSLQNLKCSVRLDNYSVTNSYQFLVKFILNFVPTSGAARNLLKVMLIVNLKFIP